MWRMRSHTPHDGCFEERGGRTGIVKVILQISTLSCNLLWCWSDRLVRGRGWCSTIYFGCRLNRNGLRHGKFVFLVVIVVHFPSFSSLLLLSAADDDLFLSLLFFLSLQLPIEKPRFVFSLLNNISWFIKTTMIATE